MTETKVKTSLQVYCHNWDGSVSGDQKVNQLVNTNCNKRHFNRSMKDVQFTVISESDNR